MNHFTTGRWRILKPGIRVHGVEQADNIWFTCCALHNMLLNVDGLDRRWKKGIKSPFEGELGWHASNDVEKYAPVIFRRVLNNLSNIRTLDSTMISRRDIAYINVEERESVTDKTKFKILKMTNKTFRDKLVIHFHKRWELKDIVWPSRTGKMVA